MNEPQLISIWTTKRVKGSYIGPHTHNYYELVYYPYGNGETVMDGASFRFEEGCFALIPPRVVHDERHHTDSAVICLMFESPLSFQVQLGKDSLQSIHTVLKSLLGEVRHQDYGYKDMIQAKLTELCLLITRGTHTDSNEKNFEYMINYLKENFHEKILLSHCAKQMNLSYDYFQHRFKQLTGVSPQRFLLLQRLKASKELLQNNRMSCTDVAFHCGFSTSAQYSALFKREYGETPLQYRKNHTSNG